MTVPRCGAAPFLLLSLSLIGTGFVRAAGTPLGQQEAAKETHWMDPPRSALIEAARRGYEGNVLSPLILYENSQTACRQSVLSVSIKTPIHLAQEIGFQRKENSDTPPKYTHIKPAVHKVKVSITFGSPRPYEPIKAGFAKDGWVYKQDGEALDSTNVVLCGNTEIFIHTATIIFRGGQSLPKEGRVMFFFRRNKRGVRYEFPVSFDDLQ